jgi:hypothetical protein
MEEMLDVCAVLSGLASCGVGKERQGVCESEGVRD